MLTTAALTEGATGIGNVAYAWNFLKVCPVVVLGIDM